MHPRRGLAPVSCVAGDPCAGVTCDGWKTCVPDTGTCALLAGRCDNLRDCQDALPTCDGATHTCEAVDHAANLVPNGGFETWSTYTVPYHGDHLLPDNWYGLATPYDTEIDPAQLTVYETTTHSGEKSLQITDTDQAERFTSETFSLPTGSFTCVYWVRGRGTIRHRTYSNLGPSPETDAVPIDSTSWAPLYFDPQGNQNDFRVVFYASYTNADKDHLQLDDVVCVQD